MEVNYHLHAQLLLRLGRKPPVAYVEEAHWAPRQIWMVWRWHKLICLRRI